METLTDSELLTIVIGRPVTVRNSAQLLAATPGELRRSPLTGEERRRLLACAELARRHQPPARLAVPVTTSRYALPYFQDLRNEQREKLAVLLLDSRLRPRSVHVVAVGTATAVMSSMRDVFVPALSAGAPAMIVAHNHPSGDPSASDRDLSFNRNLLAAAHTLEIELVDHLIVTQRSYRSLRETGSWWGDATRPSVVG